MRGASVTGQNEDHRRHRSAVDVGSSMTGVSVTKLGKLSGAFRSWTPDSKLRFI